MTPLGSERPTRFRPRLRYELIACGFNGHELVGTGAENIRTEDEVFVRRDPQGFRWYRCLRCDAWLPLAEPAAVTAPVPPDRDDIELPLRGKAQMDVQQRFGTGKTRLTTAAICCSALALN